MKVCVAHQNDTSPGLSFLSSNAQHVPDHAKRLITTDLERMSLTKRIPAQLTRPNMGKAQFLLSLQGNRGENFSQLSRCSIGFEKDKLPLRCRDCYKIKERGLQIYQAITATTFQRTKNAHLSFTFKIPFFVVQQRSTAV